MQQKATGKSGLGRGRRSRSRYCAGVGGSAGVIRVGEGAVERGGGVWKGGVRWSKVGVWQGVVGRRGEGCGQMWGKGGVMKLRGVVWCGRV